MRCLACGFLACVTSTVPAQLTESDVYLGTEHFTTSEQANMELLYKWLDDIFWSELWDGSENRAMAAAHLEQLAQLGETLLPSLAFPVAQAFYSYFWFKDNGPDLDVNVALRSIVLHEVALNHSGCDNLSMGVGDFIGKACSERWFYLIMLCAEVGREVASRRNDMAGAVALLQKAQDSFHRIMPYPFFSFRKWKSVYDLNTNSHVFGEGMVQRPVWPTEKVPLARWLESHFDVFRDDLDHIIENNLFESLYFSGRVSMTQFSGRRESWAPLSLVSNGTLAERTCEVANRTCELLRTRPELTKCSAKDVGAAFARLQPGMGIKPHFWGAPPRLGVHLGLRTPPGASMFVGDRTVEWHEGEAVVFDDTYIHGVRHVGKGERYLLIAWFCHPCDDYHAHEAVEYPAGLCSY